MSEEGPVPMCPHGVTRRDMRFGVDVMGTLKWTVLCRPDCSICSVLVSLKVIPLHAVSFKMTSSCSESNEAKEISLIIFLCKNSLENSKGLLGHFLRIGSYVILYANTKKISG